MEVAVNAFLRSDEYGNFISLSQKLIAKPSDQSNLEAGPVKYTLNNRADLKPAIAAVALRRSGLGRLLSSSDHHRQPLPVGRIAR